MKYNFDINARAFNAIKNKTKRVEIRTTKLGDNHFDYSIIKNGDEIEFKSYDGEIINCLVGDVNHYNLFINWCNMYSVHAINFYCFFITIYIIN